MNVDDLSIAYKELYSVLEKLPETPTIKSMRILFRLFPIERLIDYEVKDESLKTVLRGPTSGMNLELDNPVILAAGYSEPFMLEKALQMGFSAVTAKASKEPMKGNKGRTIIRAPGGPLNSIGFKNQGMDQLYSDLKNIRKKAGPSKRIILNISDCSIDNYCIVVLYMDPMVDMFELNSCPNSPDYERLDFFRNHGYAKDLFREVRKFTKKTIGLKMPRRKDFPDIYRETIPIAIDNGITVLNYGNTERVEDSRFETGFGGRSGPGLYDDTLENAERIYNEFGKYADVIGTGGIDSPEKAYEILTKGHAKALSYMTAFPGNIFLQKQTNEYLRIKR